MTDRRKEDEVIKSQSKADKEKGKKKERERENGSLEACRDICYHRIRVQEKNYSTAYPLAHRTTVASNAEKEQTEISSTWEHFTRTRGIFEINHEVVHVSRCWPDCRRMDFSLKQGAQGEQVQAARDHKSSFDQRVSRDSSSAKLHPATATVRPQKHQFNKVPSQITSHTTTTCYLHLTMMFTRKLKCSKVCLMQKAKVSSMMIWCVKVGLGELEVPAQSLVWTPPHWTIIFGISPRSMNTNLHSHTPIYCIIPQSSP